jgi:hypothetical protein
LTIIIDNYHGRLTVPRKLSGDPLDTSAYPELINAIVLSAMRKKTVDLLVDREEYDQLFEALHSGGVQVPGSTLEV